MNDQFDNIAKTLKELKLNQSNIMNSLNSQNEKLSTLTNNYKTLFNTVTKLLGDKNKLNEELIDLKKKVFSLMENNPMENYIVMEIMDLA